MPITGDDNGKTRPGRPMPLAKRLLFRLLAALLATVLFVGILELGLRLAGFEFQAAPIRVQERGQVHRAGLRKSSTSFWEPAKGEQGFNDQGFIGEIISPEKPAGLLRIATAGDSCTQLGSPPYAERVRQLVATSSGRKVDVLNAGVIGFSSYQGLQRLSHQVIKFKPDIVTIYFGWNDHWFWQPEHDRQFMSGTDEGVWLPNWMQSLTFSRVIQACFFTADALREINRRPATELVVRVPLEEYRSNLVEMIKLVRDAQAEPILITAPTDIVPSDRADVAAGATPRGFEAHDQYVAVTREVADQAQVRLVDAAKSMNAAALFTGDHIHLSEVGTQKIAELIAEEIGDFLRSQSGSPR